jgi:hypothetical protein
MTQVFYHPNIYIYINTYFTVIPRGKIKKERRKRKNDEVDDPKLQARRLSQNSVPRTSAGGQLFLQALQDKADHW